MKPIQTIFYSWQSDLPRGTNLNAIRECTRNACSLVESNIPEIERIDIDEATRDTPGSPNIPLTIFEKISKCDIFICDVTTINDKAPAEFKRTPNPNVLIELGYAVSAIGWDRIIMVCNTQYGKLEELPFDISRHRITTFGIKDKNDKSGKSNFTTTLETAIQSIIEKNPLRPHEKLNLSPEQIKRKNDVKNLELIFSYLHLPTFDMFLETIPLNILQRIYDYKEPFMSIFESSTFHIYDEDLFRHLSEFKDLWNSVLSYTQHYRPDKIGEYYSFYLVMDTFQDRQADDDFQKLTRISIELEKGYRRLLNFVRNNYLEINVDETSEIAFERYHRK